MWVCVCLGGGHPKSVALILPQEDSLASNDLAYTQGRRLSCLPQCPLLTSRRHGFTPTLPSCPLSQKPLFSEPIYLDGSLCFWLLGLSLVCVPKPVVLLKGTGCSFYLAYVSIPSGAKALESATARFKACFGD